MQLSERAGLPPVSGVPPNPDVLTLCQEPHRRGRTGRCMSRASQDRVAPSAEIISLPVQKASLQAKLVLGLLVAVAVVSYIDRQIFSVLAQSIKKDLGLADAELGFLYGT